MYCNALHHTATYCNTLQHTAAYCNRLQRAATHCSALQHTVTHCKSHRNKSKYTCERVMCTCAATDCNILQHTATYCNTLQHTARVIWISHSAGVIESCAHVLQQTASFRCLFAYLPLCIYVGLLQSSVHMFWVFFLDVSLYIYGSLFVYVGQFQSSVHTLIDCFWCLFVCMRESLKETTNMRTELWKRPAHIKRDTYIWKET